jgi:hypothetical protein
MRRRQLEQTTMAVEQHRSTLVDKRKQRALADQPPIAGEARRDVRVRVVERRLIRYEFR